MNPLQVVDRLKSAASQRLVDVWFIVSLLGVGLSAASYYVGVGIVPFDGRLLNGQTVAGYGLTKEVGYLAALNWSLCGALVVPALVVCSLRMHAAMEPTLRALAERSMVRTKSDFSVVTAGQLVARWKYDRAQGLFIPFVAGATAFAFIMIGWVSEVAIPSIDGISSHDMLSISSSAEEYDWSIACLMNNGHHVFAGCSESLAFTLIAYLLIPGGMTAYAFSCVIDAARFIAFACGVTRSTEVAGADGAPLPSDWELVASPIRENDARCGFGAFETFVTPFLGTVFCVLVCLFLMITQNTYLRDPESRNILDFFSQDFIGGLSGFIGLQNHHPDLSAGLAQILSSDKGISLFNPKTIFALFTYFFVVTLCLFAAMAVLRRAGAGARDLALNHVGEFVAQTGLDATVIRERLDKMSFWPLRWITQNTTIVVTVFMSLALLSFRLALFPTLIGVAMLAGVMWRNRRPRRPKTETRPIVTAEIQPASPLRLERALGPTPPPPPQRGVDVSLLISYRRSDSAAIAGRIRDNLALHFGENSVFMDIDSIPFGFDFRDQIRQALTHTNMVLAIVGPNWLGKGKDGRPRVWEETDPVRFEIEMALHQSIPVIPVLVEGATMPSPDDLPPSLRDFHYRNAVTVDSGRDFHPHLERLMRSMEASLASRAAAPPPA